jgi:hypothetical protein
MPAELQFYPDEATARITPDALRVMLNQSGLRCSTQREDEQPTLVLAEDETMLKLRVEEGIVTGIAVCATFVDEASRLEELCELLESLGWVEH